MTERPFDLHSVFRALAEKNMDLAREALAQYLSAMSNNVNANAKPAGATEVTAAFSAVQDKAIAFAKEGSEASIAFAGQLAKAKDIQEILTLQAQFAQEIMKAHAQQTIELGQIISGSSKN